MSDYRPSPVGPGNRVARGKLSQLMLGGIVYPNTAIAFGNQNLTIDLTPATVFDGSAWWAVPNSGLPLGLATSATGLLYPPTLDDVILDIAIVAGNLSCNAADANKLVDIYFTGNWGRSFIFSRVKTGIYANTCFFAGTMTDYLFAGDTGKKLVMNIDTGNLTVNPTLSFQVQVTARTGPA